MILTLVFHLLAKSIERKMQNFRFFLRIFPDHSSLNKLCFPAVIKVVKGIRIGIIGLVTQAELKIC